VLFRSTDTGKNGSTVREYIGYSDFKKAYDSGTREVLYNILIEIGEAVKPIRLIKMCLNETYNSLNR
jgi:hypothetical protein